MLHIIRSSGFNTNALNHCLETVLPQDAILLIDDGCYNLNHPLLLATEKSELTIYFIASHAYARAQFIVNSEENSYIAITLDDIFSIIFKHENSITWS